MADSLFLLGADGSLKTMNAAAFVSEDEFQTLLERHPELLTDADFGEAEPRRWVLVKRESAVPDAEGAGGRWSLDHLFLDQDGVPTLIEVKRASDTRARREVVAQMLDYAANAVSWWRVEELAAWFEATCAGAGRDPVRTLTDLLQAEVADAESYWRRVEANLGSGRIRMLFVADAIAPELQRIVEFLNEQMKPAVVAAVELKPFASGVGERLLAPRIVGLTAKAEAAKTVARRAPVEMSVEDWLENELSAPARELGRRFVEQLRRHADGVAVTNSGDGVTGWVMADGKARYPAFVRKAGHFWIAPRYLMSTRAFADDGSRREMLDRFKAVPGVSLSTDNINGYPDAPLTQLSSPEAWAALDEALRWTYAKLRSS